MRPARKAMALAPLLAMLLAGCGGGASGEDGDTASAEGDSSSDVCTPERAGGTITMGTFTFTKGLDPIVALGRQAGSLENTAIYDTLMRYDPESDAIVPHMAESLEANADYTEWTLTLRPDVSFSNGDPVTTEAVQFSMERLGNSSVGFAAMAEEVASMTVTDDHVMTFTLRRPWSGFPYLLAGEGGMVVNPKAVKAAGEEFATNPVGAGAGPFEIERFAAGEEIVLTANENYWGGPVCVDQLRVVSISGAQGTYDAFRSGELDVFFTQDARTNDQIKRDGTAHYSTVVPGSNALLVNNGKNGTTTPGQDLRVRQAVAMAIDVEALDERIYEGTGFPSGALFADLEGPEYDPEGARALVEEAKADGWDGKTRLMCQDTPEHTELSITLEAQLEAAGMEIDRSNVPLSTLQASLLGTNGQPDFDLSCWALTTPTVGAFSSLSAWESGNVRNRVGYADPRMDAALLNYMSAANSGDELAKAEAEIQAVWNETIPSVALGGQEWLVGYSESVHGLTFTRDSVTMFHQAYVD